MKNRYAAAIIVGIGLLSAPAFAEERGGRMWDKLDADGDGRVALSDLKGKHAERLAKADANGDGYITREEMRAYSEARRSEWRAKRFPDANGDGSVSRSEFEAASKERFDKLDKNGDGKLTEDELSPRRHGGKRGG